MDAPQDPSSDPTRDPNSDRPFRVGTCLFTLVEPHEGQAVAFNRWYERDHFYAGMMAFPHVVAGRRWYRPRRLRGATPERGTFLAVYWIEDGRHDDFLRAAVPAVAALTEQGRTFEARDHVHTGFYAIESWAGSPPPELALDHPFGGLVAQLGGSPPTEPGVDLVTTWTPLPTPGFAPSPAPLHLAFVRATPQEPVARGADAEWTATFVPTVPGLDPDDI